MDAKFEAVFHEYVNPYLPEFMRMPPIIWAMLVIAAIGQGLSWHVMRQKRRLRQRSRFDGKTGRARGAFNGKKAGDAMSMDEYTAMFQQMYGQEFDKDLANGKKKAGLSGATGDGTKESMFKNVTLPAHVHPEANESLGPDFVRAMMNNHASPSVRAMNALFGNDGKAKDHSGAGSGGGDNVGGLVGGADGERYPAGYMTHIKKCAEEINKPEEDINQLRKRAEANTGEDEPENE